MAPKSIIFGPVNILYSISPVNSIQLSFFSKNVFVSEENLFLIF